MINLVLVVAGVACVGLSIGFAVAIIIDWIERNEQ